MNVSCKTTDTTGKLSNGTATLNISGGTPPYSIIWVYPNGTRRVSGPLLTNLSIGTYTAIITDYYGDFTVTTSCVVSRTTSTTTTTTTTSPPISAGEFCLIIQGKIGRGFEGNINTFYYQNDFTGTTVGGVTTYTSTNGLEYVYLNNNSNVWMLSGSTSSPIYQFNITAINPNPNAFPYFDPINNPGYVGWVISSPQFPIISSSANSGLCS